MKNKLLFAVPILIIGVALIVTMNQSTYLTEAYTEITIDDLEFSDFSDIEVGTTYRYKIFNNEKLMLNKFGTIGSETRFVEFTVTENDNGLVSTFTWMEENGTIIYTSFDIHGFNVWAFVFFHDLDPHADPYIGPRTYWESDNYYKMIETDDDGNLHWEFIFDKNFILQYHKIISSNFYEVYDAEEISITTLVSVS